MEPSAAIAQPGHIPPLQAGLLGSARHGEGSGDRDETDGAGHADRDVRVPTDAVDELALLGRPHSFQPPDLRRGAECLDACPYPATDPRPACAACILHSEKLHPAPARRKHFFVFLRPADGARGRSRSCGTDARPDALSALLQEARLSRAVQNCGDFIAVQSPRLRRGKPNTSKFRWSSFLGALHGQIPFRFPR